MDPTLLFTSIPDAVPLGPAHAEAVGKAHVTLRWHPAPGATAYRVQISPDKHFTHLMFQQDVPAIVDAIELEYRAVGRPRVFYWRVLAGNRQGWSAGRHVETLTTGAADEGGPLADPDLLRDFGIEPDPLSDTSLFHLWATPTYGDPTSPPLASQPDAAAGPTRPSERPPPPAHN
jgi:hypothetical protein